MIDREIQPPPDYKQILSARKFFIADLQEDAMRNSIAVALKSMQWIMTVGSISTPEANRDPYGFLKHPCFPEGVHFLLKNVQPGAAKSEPIAPGTRISLTIKLRHQPQRGWSYVLDRGGICPPSPENDHAIRELERAEVLGSIRHFASWNSATGTTKVASLRDEFVALFSEDEREEAAAQVAEAIRLGEEDAELLKPFYSRGQTLGKDFAAQPDFQLELSKLPRQLQGQAKKQADRGASSAQRKSETLQRKREGKEMSSVRPVKVDDTAGGAGLPPLRRQTTPATDLRAELHPRDIRRLAPSGTWTLVVDETGNHFGEGKPAKPSDIGRFVGVLIPEGGNALEGLKPGWHAVDESIADIDTVVQAALDAPIGILGLSLQQLPNTPGERWAMGVVQLLRLVLRMMPIEGPTTLNVLVEQRAPFNKNEWPMLAESERALLTQAYPTRGEQLKLEVKTIEKDGSPFNGYADALAFIWGSPAPHSRECLKKTGLVGTCFLTGSAEALARTMDWLDRGASLDPGDWTTLVSEAQADLEANPAWLVLARLGEMSRSDPGLWRKYLDHVLAHIDSRALDLPRLGRQVAWLHRYAPENESLPPTLRLLWLTVQLARANHLGETRPDWAREMEALADRLIDEDARLVCRAELNLAVSATNSFDFATASRALRRWNPPAPAKRSRLLELLQRVLGTPESAPESTATLKATAGIRYWGQVRSSLGQHAAFCNDLKTAITLFDEALAAFAGLSDRVLIERESAQTACYRAIAMMDDPTVSDADVREAVIRVTGPLDKAIPVLADSMAAGEKYAHHLLLRWLVHRKPRLETEAYLAQRACWKHDEGHPWPLIQLYRALLVKAADPDAALILAQESNDLAEGEGQSGVVRLIGACARAIAFGWGTPWLERDEVISRLTKTLPLAGDRIGKLAAYDAQDDPLKLLCDVLPFNFR